MRRQGLYWKMAYPILLIFVTVICFLIYYIPGLVEQNIIRSVTKAGEQTAGQFKIIRGYYTKNIIKKVLQGTEIRPAIDHQGVAGKIPLPATMVHDLSALLKDAGLSLQLYSPFPFPNRQSRQLSPLQKSTWESLKKNPDQTVVTEQLIDGETIVSVAISDKMVAQGCVDCHNRLPNTPKNDWQLGGGLSSRGITSEYQHQRRAAGRPANQLETNWLINPGTLWHHAFAIDCL